MAASIKTINEYIPAIPLQSMSYKNTHANVAHKDIYYSVVPKREIYLVYTKWELAKKNSVIPIL